MTGNEIQPFLKSRIRIPIQLCSLPIHSPGICMLRPIKLSTVIMLGECMRDAWVINQDTYPPLRLQDYYCNTLLTIQPTKTSVEMFITCYCSYS